MKLKPEILLHPNIPKPLHGINPRSIFGQEWWDEKRQIAYAEYEYHCWACGVSKYDAKEKQWLEAHECYEIDYSIGEAKMIMISALCHFCHNSIHSGKLSMDLRAGKISQEKYDDVLEHKEEVLSNAEFWGLIDINKNPFIKNSDTFQLVSWEDWYLLLDGKKYYSRFKDIEEWAEFYRNK